MTPTGATAPNEAVSSGRRFLRWLRLLGAAAVLVALVPADGCEIWVSYVLPRTVKVTLNEQDPTKSKLVCSGIFDLGPDPVDLSLPALLEVGGYSVSAALAPNAKGTLYKLEQQGLLFLVKPAKSGSSRALFKLKIKDDLTGLVDPQAPLALHFMNDAIDGIGTVALDEGKYKLGKLKGALIAPSLFLSKCKAKLVDGAGDSLLLKAGLATGGITPPVAPDFLVLLGESWGDSVPSASFVQDGDRFVFKGPVGGLTSVILDYAKELITVKAKGVELGTFADGPLPVQVAFLLGSDDGRAVAVRMVHKGSSLKY